MQRQIKNELLLNTVIITIAITITIITITTTAVRFCYYS